MVGYICVYIYIALKYQPYLSVMIPEKRSVYPWYNCTIDMLSSLNNLKIFPFPLCNSPWNLSIVDSPEEVHLIFHMWIGLFYSRSPSRFFHFDPIGRVLQVGGNLPKETDLNSTAGFSKFNQMKVSTQLNTSLVSSALPAEPGVLHTSDETRKTSVPSSEVLDLSVKSCEPLDLTSVNIKTVETSTEKHDPLSLESPVREMKSQVVSTSTDFQLKVSSMME